MRVSPVALNNFLLVQQRPADGLHATQIKSLMLAFLRAGEFSS